MYTFWIVHTSYNPIHLHPNANIEFSNLFIHVLQQNYSTVTTIAIDRFSKNFVREVSVPVSLIVLYLDTLSNFSHFRASVNQRQFNDNGDLVDFLLNFTYRFFECICICFLIKNSFVS